MSDTSGSIHDRKTELRRRMRLTRDLIEDRSMRSLDLWGHLADAPEYQRAVNVMAFCGSRGEPDTDSLFARLAAEGKTLILPSTEWRVIVPRLVGAGLKEGRYGILNPQGDVVPTNDIDLVIVPGLAFSADGERLGQGGGYYDRFLPTLPSTCRSVGVCFVEQLLDDIPRDGHDQRVGRVVTDVGFEPSN